MPRYEYQCNKCGHSTQKYFSMGQAPALVECAFCFEDAKKDNIATYFANRVFSLPHLTTQPVHLRDENKYGTLPPGQPYSEKFLTEQRKEDDARYERDRNKKVGPGLSGV